jgi:multiple sugar transport system substrate-binding protein
MNTPAPPRSPPMRPHLKKYGAIQDAMNRELQAIWLTGKDISAALADAEGDIQEQLDD